MLPAAIRRFGRRRTVPLVGLAIVGSIVLMNATADITAPERAYYGTDTRAFGILAGAVLAFWWRPERVRHAISVPARWTIDLAGGLAMVGLLWQFANRSEFDPWTYPQGFLLVDALTLILLVVATHPASRFARRVGTRAFAELGRRQVPLSPTDGQPMKRIDRDRVAALLDRDEPGDASPRDVA